MLETSSCCGGEEDVDGNDGGVGGGDVCYDGDGDGGAASYCYRPL